MTSPGSNPFGDLPETPGAYAPQSFQGEVVKAELVETGPPDPGERISILYLMVWTAGSAVILAFYRQAMSQSQDDPSPLNPLWLQTSMALLMSPLQGAGVAALGLAIWRKFRGGRPFPRQPGHWLLVIAGVSAVASWPLYLLTRDYFRNGPAVYLIVYRLPLVVLFFGLAILAMTQMPTERLWRKMFLIWILANGVQVVGLCCLGSISYARYYSWVRVPELFLSAAIPLAFLVTGILDRASGARRDALHWAGVASRIAYLAWVALEIVRMSLPRP